MLSLRQSLKTISLYGIVSGTPYKTERLAMGIQQSKIFLFYALGLSVLLLSLAILINVVKKKK